MRGPYLPAPEGPEHVWMRAQRVIFNTIMWRTEVTITVGVVLAAAWGIVGGRVGEFMFHLPLPSWLAVVFLLLYAMLKVGTYLPPTPRKR